MVHGRVYIENLRTKVTKLFDELKAENRLGEKNFIEAFKKKYPKDYRLLQWEWEFKVHQFKKNRKGAPQHQPLKPEQILSNMYRNYYFKLIEKTTHKEKRRTQINNIKRRIGNRGYRIRMATTDTYNVINSNTKEIEYGNVDYPTLKKIANDIINTPTKCSKQTK